jgi:hypothetical protein
MADMFTTKTGMSKSKGSPLPDLERAALMLLVQAHGERFVLQAIGVNGQTFARAVAGLPIYPGSAALIRIGLSKLERDADRLQAAEREGAGR